MKILANELKDGDMLKVFGGLQRVYNVKRVDTMIHYNVKINGHVHPHSVALSDELNICERIERKRDMKEYEHLSAKYLKDRDLVEMDGYYCEIRNVKRDNNHVTFDYKNGKTEITYRAFKFSTFNVKRVCSTEEKESGLKIRGSSVKVGDYVLIDDKYREIIDILQKTPVFLRLIHATGFKVIKLNDTVTIRRTEEPSQRTINVGSVEYTVRDVDFIDLDGDRNYQGLCDYVNTEIQLIKDMSEERRQETLIHELTHAIFYEAGYEEQDEDMITRVGKSLFQVLKNNDKLL